MQQPDPTRTTIAINDPTRHLLHLGEVAQQLGVCLSAAIRMKREGRLPKPVVFGPDLWAPTDIAERRRQLDAQAQQPRVA